MREGALATHALGNKQLSAKINRFISVQLSACAERKRKYPITDIELWKLRLVEQ